MDCTWNEPGLNAYQGSVVAAVARYKYPRDVQDRLAERAKRFDFDFLIEIRRDSVVGSGVEWTLADMHYGRRDMCKGNVARDKWPATQLERALAYCEASYCIAVPFVCRNVSRLLPVLPRHTSTVSRYRSLPGDSLAAPRLPPVRPVPEPGSLWLALAALVALGLSQLGRKGPVIIGKEL